VYRIQSKARGFAGAAALAVATVAGATYGLSTVAQSQAKNHEVTVTVHRVAAIDKIDAASRPDFYARVTIAGNRQTTQFIKDKVDISPNWQISAAVPPGRTLVKVEILDKDISVDDPVDINRLAGKRDLDFTVDTRNCRIDGFANGYKCGDKITRAGDQRKGAEITFSVSVKK
jgi:hypothetical protein